MFSISMPKSFKVGDTQDCRIDGKPKRLTWRDEKTLLIEPDDARAIVTHVVEGGWHAFVCGDPGCDAREYDVVTHPDGFYVFAKPAASRVEILTTKKPARS